MNWKKYVRIFIFVWLLILFYLAGFSPQLIIFIGIFMLLLMIFKSKLYKKIDHLIRHKFHFISKLPDWVVKLIIIIIFLLIYLLIKQVVFTIMKFFGVDIQKIILDGINQSLLG